MTIREDRRKQFIDYFIDEYKNGDIKSYDDFHNIVRNFSISEKIEKLKEILGE
jgi:hypothetical protein